MFDIRIKRKIAIGVTGKVVLLEKFPDDETHSFMNDLIDDFEKNTDSLETPGVYLAQFGLENIGSKDPTEDDVYLVITDFPVLIESV